MKLPLLELHVYISTNPSFRNSKKREKKARNIAKSFEGSCCRKNEIQALENDCFEPSEIF